MKKVMNLLSVMAIIVTMVVSFAFKSNTFLPERYAIVGETTNSYIVNENLAGEVIGTDYNCNSVTGIRCVATQNSGTPLSFAQPGVTQIKVAKNDSRFTWSTTDEQYQDIYTVALGDND